MEMHPYPLPVSKRLCFCRGEMTAKTYWRLGVNFNGSLRLNTSMYLLSVLVSAKKIKKKLGNGQNIFQGVTILKLKSVECSHAFYGTACARWLAWAVVMETVSSSHKQWLKVQRFKDFTAKEPTVSFKNSIKRDNVFDYNSIVRFD